jgi:hypothetical protein
VPQSPGGGAAYRFLALVPHANTRAEFGKYGRRLFREGAAGFCSFPAAAPVALLSAPASGSELKRLAALFRLQSYKNGGGGRICSGRISSVRLPDGMTLAGPLLSLEAPSLPDLPALVERFPRLILCAGIFPSAPDTPPPPEPLRFSAAALVNMVLRPLRYGQSYEWTLGEAHWLPPVRRGPDFG